MENQTTPLLIGALAGDIIGSRFEHYNIKSTSFELFQRSSHFTDDTVMTIATAESILNKSSIVEAFQKYGRKYPNAGYGGTFYRWIFDENPKPYNSWGNGSAMRVSPVGYAYSSEEEVLEHAKKSAKVSHNHEEGIKGAQATAMCIFLARTGKNKEEIRSYVERNFGYDLSISLDEIRPNYHFDVSCQGSVPQAIRAFLESSDFENAIRLAISIGGDSDTIACITGGIAHAFYKFIPDVIVQGVLERLPSDMLEVVERFDEVFYFLLMEGGRGEEPQGQ
jgi:ADP-ribosylglycohydrolase